MRLVTLGIVTLALVSCGGGDGSGNDGGRSIDPCALISVAEAEVWLGGAVEPPAPYDGPDPEPTCVFRSTGAQTQILLQGYDGAQYYGDDNAELHPDAQPLGVGEKGYIDNGSVGFLQNG